MLLSRQNLIMNINRSMEHLQALIDQQQKTNSLSALCYSAKLLLKYAQEYTKQERDEKTKIEDSKMFEKFNQLLKIYGGKDLNHLKKVQQQILEQLYTDVNQPQFQKNLRPDIQQIKKSHQQKYNQVVYASNRSFHIQDNQRQQGLKGSKLKKNDSSDGLNKYDELWQRMERSYRQHDIDQAYSLCQQYKEKVGNPQKIPSYRKQLMETIQLEFNTMTTFYQEFSQGGWVFDREQKGITLQYKIFQEQKQIAILIHAQVQIPIEHFIAIISQIDLMEKYVPFCYDSKQQKVISRNEKIGTSKIYIPLLTDRQTFFYAAGYNRIKKCNSIFLFSKTINTDKIYQQKYQFKVPEESNYVRLQYKFFIIEYIPITRTKAKIRLASKVDMKLNFLPQFILHKSARTFAFDYFKNIIKKSNKFKGSAWEKKVHQNPAIYKFFRQKIDDYFRQTA